MEYEKNAIYSLGAVLGRWGWGGNPDPSVDTPEKAYERLESLVDKQEIFSEFEEVANRNDCLLRAIHFQDRKLTSEIKEVLDYLTHDEVKEQVLHSYHRHNGLLNVYQGVEQATREFPELPNKDLGPHFSAINVDEARFGLNGVNLEGLMGEMEKIDSKNDCLITFIHQKEMGIVGYVNAAIENLGPNEIRRKVKEAYHRNHSIFDSYKAVTKAEEYLSEITREVILGSRHLIGEFSEEELLMRQVNN